MSSLISGLLPFRTVELPYVYYLRRYCVTPTAEYGFEQYWRFHEQREYQRNHASRYSGGNVVPVQGRHLKRIK